MGSLLLFSTPRLSLCSNDYFDDSVAHVVESVLAASFLDRRLLDIANSTTRLLAGLLTMAGLEDTISTEFGLTVRVCQGDSPTPPCTPVFLTTQNADRKLAVCSNRRRNFQVADGNLIVAPVARRFSRAAKRAPVPCRDNRHPIDCHSPGREHGGHFAAGVGPCTC